jgi:hypothetical protein
MDMYYWIIGYFERKKEKQATTDDNGKYKYCLYCAVVFIT